MIYKIICYNGIGMMVDELVRRKEGAKAPRDGSYKEPPLPRCQGGDSVPGEMCLLPVG